jgi:hypothetical protein
MYFDISGITSLVHIMFNNYANNKQLGHKMSIAANCIHTIYNSFIHLCTQRMLS